MDAIPDSAQFCSLKSVKLFIKFANCLYIVFLFINQGLTG